STYARSDLPRPAFSPDGGLLVLVGRDGAQVWGMRPDGRPAVDLASLAGLLAGRRIDATGGAVPLPVDALRTTWEALPARRPAAAVPEDSASRPAGPVAPGR